MIRAQRTWFVTTKEPNLITSLVSGILPRLSPRVVSNSRRNSSAEAGGGAHQPKPDGTFLARFHARHTSFTPPPWRPRYTGSSRRGEQRRSKAKQKAPFSAQSHVPSHVEVQRRNRSRAHATRGELLQTHSHTQMHVQQRGDTSWGWPCALGMTPPTPSALLLIHRWPPSPL